ncbi:MAG TPA: DUF3558 domain-containing protein [Pseudonocardiaceae bacterium]|nr:DUF3558 domain-containing protein [Pseudonocardiaceae bacterium]
MRASTLLFSLAVLAGASACADPTTGTASPAPSEAERPSNSAGAPLPTRPESLPLDGVDPCSLLTDQQLAAFSIDRPPANGQSSSGPLKGAPDCNFEASSGSANDWGFLIIASTSVGLPAYLEQIQGNPTRRVITVSGFPAIQDEQKSSVGPGNDTCFVDVDVADGQMLALQFGQVAADPDKVLPMETLCAKAVEVAEAALTTLQGQR